MSQYLKFLILSIGFAGLPLPAFSQTAYPLGIRSLFLHGCITDGESRPKPTEIDTRICLCLLDRVQEKFTLTQFSAMAPALSNSKRKENDLEVFLENQILQCI